jgi:hypothetical protein
VFNILCTKQAQNGAIRKHKKGITSKHKKVPQESVKRILCSVASDASLKTRLRSQHKTIYGTAVILHLDIHIATSTE